MGRSAAEAQSGNIVWNGKSFFQMDTGVVAFSAASQRNIGTVVAPCDAEIVAANVRILASATGPSAKIRLGLNANTSGLMTKYLLGGNLASTVLNLLTASTWVASASKFVRKGDVISLHASLGTAVGSFAATLIFQPR